MNTLHRRAGFTLLELMIAMAIGVMALTAAFSAALTMQRCLAASEEFAADKTEQTRLSDFLALDLRRALTVTGASGTTILTLTIPNYYDSAGNPVTPTIQKTPQGAIATYGTPVTVVYRKFGSTISRTVGSGAPMVIATNVGDFECNVDGIGTNSYVETRVTFLPSFQRNGTPGASARTATTVYNTVQLRNKS
jgi:prepilin-type N-terminal cleavage/methylation domain-containing protein